MPDTAKTKSKKKLTPEEKEALKQKVIQGLIDKGKAAGKLTTNDIDDAIVKIDLEID